LNYGAWLPAAYPTDGLIEHYPYVQVIVNRPWHFYLTGLLLTAPVFIFAAFGMLRPFFAVYGSAICRPIAVPLVWAVVVFAALLTLGVRGQGFQLRYLAPAMPAVCILTAAGLIPWLRSGPSRFLVGGVAAALAAVTAVNAVQAPLEPPAAEPVPFTLAIAFESLGLDFWRFFPGYWRPA
jgi:hypothetical protein